MDPIEIDSEACMSALRVLLTILEAYQGKIDQSLPQLIGMILTEMKS